jgi:hypothetical protein
MRRLTPAAGGRKGSAWGPGSGVELDAELRHLGPALVPGLLNDGLDLRVGEEVLKALLIPVEKDPGPIVLIGIAKDARTLGPVLLSLLNALRLSGRQAASVKVAYRRSEGPSCL